MKNEYREFFKDSFIEHLKQFGNINAEYIGVNNTQNKDSAIFVSSIIGLIGEVEGSVVLSFSETLSLQIASTMLMEEIVEMNYDARDALGEFANIVVGNARNKLVDAGFDVKISPPTIIVGQKHEIFYPPKTLIDELVFGFNEEKIYLTIGIKG